MRSYFLENFIKKEQVDWAHFIICIKKASQKKRL
jgi:hypothetical protein